LPALACGGDLAATLGHEPFDCHLRAVIQRYGLMSLFRNVGYGPHHQAIKPTGYDDDADAVIPEAMAQWRATYRALPEPHQIIAATIIWLIAAARTQSGCVAWPSHGRRPTRLLISAQPVRWPTGACLLPFIPAGEDSAKAVPATLAGIENFAARSGAFGRLLMARGFAERIVERTTKHKTVGPSRRRRCVRSSPHSNFVD
jgi:hypothetical protein